jgi:nucleoside-diphosphate-sugar epimerase
MNTALIFGGAGYIGLATFKRLRAQFDRIILADIRPPAEPLPESVVYVECDVSRPMVEWRIADSGCRKGNISWIFNYAAIHREPGHSFEEYFDTNVPGAEHVTAFAEAYAVPNIYFTASIAVYGPTHAPTDEQTPKYPSSGYGISKLTAELIHERWAAAEPERRLVVCRPGVVYGPGDPGNILRMIRAVAKGIFIFPGSPEIHKSYAYIEGLLDSIEFTMARTEKVIHYNYVESPTEPLGALVTHIEQILGKRSLRLRAPIGLLVIVAQVIQWLTAGKSPIHPKRVRKAAMPTHIVPQWLMDNGFEFRYNFDASLRDWKARSPEDF